MEAICVVCEHSPHSDKSCVRCGCTNWMNSTVASARAAIQINNILVTELPKAISIMADIAEIAAELYPEVVDKINTRRKALREEREKENNGNNETAASNTSSKSDPTN